MKHTKEPWIHILGKDTHKVQRDREGRMLGKVTMDLDDYDRACACVNACAGLNPEAIPALVAALEKCVEAGTLIQVGNRGGAVMGSVSSATDEARTALATLKGE